MVGVTFDAELIEDSIAATPISRSSTTSCCRDGEGQIVVFTCSREETPSLNVIFSDGKTVYLNSSLPTQTKIQAFNIHQADDGLIRLVLGQESLVSPSHSKIFFSDPFALDTLRGTENIQLTGLTTECEMIYDILLAPSLGPKGAYPCVIVNHKANRAVSGKDLTSFNIDQGEIIRSGSVEVPQNAAEILDFTPVSVPIGTGLAILYRVTNDPVPRLVLALRGLPDPQIPGHIPTSKTLLKCPKDAICLGTFDNGKGYTDLLVGTESGIGHFKAIQMSFPDAVGEYYSVMRGSKQLLIATSGEDLTLWSIDRDGVISYMQAKVKAPCSGEPVNLFPASPGTTITPALTVAGTSVLWQTLVLSDNDGNISILEQVSDTGMWRDKRLWMSCINRDIDELVNIRCWAIHITATNATTEPAKQVILKASSHVSTFVHRTNVILNPISGTVMDLDSDGKVMLTIPTEDLAAQIITVTHVITTDGTKHPLPNPIIINPAMKAHQALTAMTTEDLKKLYPTGSSCPSDSDLGETCLVLAKLTNVATSLPSDGSIASGRNISTVVQTNTAGVAGSSWAWWEWVKQAIRSAAVQIKNFIVEQLNNMWHFVVQIGNKVWNFVLDSVEKVGAALSGLFSAIGLKLKDLWEAVAFLFNWGDIIQTKNTISDLISAGLDLGLDKINDCALKADEFVDNVKSQLRDGLNGSIFEKASDRLRSTQGIVEAEKGESPAGKNENSIGFNWIGSKLRDSLSEVGSTDSDPSTSVADKPTEYRKKVEELFEQHIAASWKQAEQSFKDAGKCISEAYKTVITGDLSHETLDALLRAGGDVLNGLIEGFRAIVIAVLNLLSKPLRWLLNKEEEDESMPPKENFLRFLWAKLGSWLRGLYKKCCGRDFSLIDFVSLLIAIPTTFACKLFGKGAPPVITEPQGQGRNEYLKSLILKNSPDLQNDGNMYKFAVLGGATMVGGKYVLNKYNELTSVLQLANVDGITKLAKTKQIGFLDAAKGLLDVTQIIIAWPGGQEGPDAECLRAITALAALRSTIRVAAYWSGFGKDPMSAKLIAGQDFCLALVGYCLAQRINIKALTTSDDDSSKLKKASITTLCAHMNLVANGGDFVLTCFHDIEPQTAALGALAAMAGNQGVWVTNGLHFGRDEKDMSSYVYSL